MAAAGPSGVSGHPRYQKKNLVKSEFEECVRDIVGAENTRCQGLYQVGSLSRVDKPGFKSDVGDSPGIYQLDGVHSRDDAILFVSNAEFPDFVTRAAEKAEAVVAALAPAPASHVLRPVARGMQGTRSYALYLRLRTLSANRIVKATQVAVIRADIFQWLCDVGSDTRTGGLSDADLKERFIAPYTYLAGETRFSQTIRSQAAIAIEAIETGAFRPISIVQHGDFWQGNILLNKTWPIRRPRANSFSIIDWGGSSITGYPYIDLLRFSLSIGQRDRAILQNLTRYDTACALSGADLLNYVCAHAGYVGLDRGSFPLERYVRSMETLFAAAVRLGQ